IECPTGSGNFLTLWEVAQEISRRLSSVFLRSEDGLRPVHGTSDKFQDDPAWKDLVLFYEYFHGDNGRGVGASHQTGWTGVVAKCLEDIATNHSRRIADALMPEKLTAHEGRVGVTLPRQVERVGAGSPS